MMNDQIAIRFGRCFDIVPDQKPLRLDWVHVAVGPKMRLWHSPSGAWVLTIPPRIYMGEPIDVEHLTFTTFDRGVQAVGQFASTARLGLWRYQGADDMPEKIPLDPPLPDHYAPVARWKAVLALSVGLLSALATGIAIVWLWVRFVVVCS